MQFKQLTWFAGAMAFCLALAGCKPPVDSVPITEPWSSMNLPIDSSAIVWGSTPDEVKILHQGRIEVVAQAYIDYFENGGWTCTQRDIGTAYTYGYRKDGQNISLFIYPFQDVGVIIKRM